MKLTKDPKIQNLYIDPKSQRYYFRRSLTVGGRTQEICKSLKTTDREEAKSRINEILLTLPDFLGRKKRPIIDDLIGELLDVYQGLAKSSFQSFEYYTRIYILPFYTGQDAKDVAGSWELFKARVKAQKQGMGLEHVRRHLSRILHYAAEKNLIDGVPRLKLLPSEKSNTKPRAYDAVEVETIFNGEPKERFQEKTLVKLRLQSKLTLFCGLRPPSEIVNLKWEYFDFPKGLLFLPAEIVKTRQSRTVPIATEMIHDLLQWKKLLKKRYKDSPYVFPMRGNPNAPASTKADGSWQRYKKSMGIEAKRYWLRHSHGTALIAAGIPEMIVAKDMGTSPRMLREIYVDHKKESIEEKAEIVKRKYRGIK